ncbi:hypothetical protein [Pseudolysinimonas yzui]|uniref:Uncharacterized protein n=1 Tax=Pseudolysinimonas yzui TaxID=2708254 RepID=A0A8J3M2U1_9MICO|nr:hypothetical protein [Pseudolysinimonas yzui]GHF22661.1 hypothetical protein GCM10011600_24750 [Pseudolysinimonas yzui]
MRGRLKFRVGQMVDAAFSLVVEAWRMVVLQKVSRAYDIAHPDGPN